MEKDLSAIVQALLQVIYAVEFQANVQCSERMKADLREMLKNLSKANHA